MKKKKIVEKEFDLFSKKQRKVIAFAWALLGLFTWLIAVSTINDLLTQYSLAAITFTFVASMFNGATRY